MCGVDQGMAKGVGLAWIGGIGVVALADLEAIMAICCCAGGDAALTRQRGMQSFKRASVTGFTLAHVLRQMHRRTLSPPCCC